MHKVWFYILISLYIILSLQNMYCIRVQCIPLMMHTFAATKLAFFQNFTYFKLRVKEVDFLNYDKLI